MVGVLLQNSQLSMVGCHHRSFDSQSKHGWVCILSMVGCLLQAWFAPYIVVLPCQAICAGRKFWALISTGCHTQMAFAQNEFIYDCPRKKQAFLFLAGSDFTAGQSQEIKNLRKIKKEIFSGTIFVQPVSVSYKSQYILVFGKIGMSRPFGVKHVQRGICNN